MVERNQFTFYKSFKTHAETLGKANRLAFYDAITDYGIYGELKTPISPKLQGILDLVKPVLDSGARKSARVLKAVEKRKQSVNKKESDVEVEVDTEVEIDTEVDIDIDTETDIDRHKGVCVDHSFAPFWNAYPVQMDRKGAEEAWAQLKPDEQTVRQILVSLEAWKQSARWENEGGRYIPNPATFLEKGYWRQMPAEPGGKKTIPKGASGVMGETELENMRRMMEER